MGGNGVMGDFSYVEKPINIKSRIFIAAAKEEEKHFDHQTICLELKLQGDFMGFPWFPTKSFLKKWGLYLVN